MTDEAEADDDEVEAEVLPSVTALGHPRAVRVIVTVDPHLGGARADQFLSQRIRRLSRTRAAAIIERGDLQRPEGRSLRPSSRVVAGEELVLWRIPPDEEPPDLSLTLLFQDDHLAVFDKPPTLAIHPSARYYAGTFTQLFLRRGYPRSQAEDAVHIPHPVHRLDRETSGVLVCARATAAERTWKNAFLKGRVEKTYLALCEGTPTFTHAVLDAPLGILKGLRVRIKVGPTPDGQPARTDVDVLWSGGGKALVRCHPRTGRTHQIRAHLSAVGLPLMGDKLYGRQGDDWFVEYADHGMTPELAASLSHTRHALHAAILQGEKHRFVAPWPMDLRALSPEAAAAADAALAREERVPDVEPTHWLARAVLPP
jgi:23S rRNA pseudouridine1911/1915/1917 synthase